MIEKKRLLAIKTRLKNLNGGKYVKDESGSFVLTKYGQRIGRARIVATVVDKFVSDDKKFYSITLDDGTDTIRAKAFNSLVLDGVNQGDIIDLIGKIRVYNDELYIITENLWKLSDPNYEILRELEIQTQSKELEKKKKLVLMYQKQAGDLNELKHFMKDFGIGPEEVEAVLESQSIEDQEPTMTQTEEQKAKILSLIDQFDKGEGVDYSDLLRESGLDESAVDTAVQELLNEGSCFEPRPGKIKKL